MRHCKDPVDLTTPMDGYNPDILHPVFSTLDAFPQFPIWLLVTDAGEVERREKSATLSEMVSCIILREQLLQDNCTTIDAGIVEESRRGIEYSKLLFRKPIFSIGPISVF
jgi:hypothetical protein